MRLDLAGGGGRMGGGGGGSGCGGGEERKGGGGRGVGEGSRAAHLGGATSLPLLVVVTRSGVVEFHSGD